jgi:hypothetical protein
MDETLVVLDRIVTNHNEIVVVDDLVVADDLVATEYE